MEAIRAPALCFLAAGLLAIPAPARAADAVKDQLIVGFRDGTSLDRRADLVRAAGGRTTRRLDRIRAAVVRPRAGAKARDLRSRLRRRHAVRYLKGNVWHNPDEIQGNGKDDDRNGWVDDYYGVNIPKGSGSGTDDDGHGTHVAGIVAGHGNNAAGVAGACWTAQVMPVRFMDAHGRGSTSDAVTGLDYAIHEGAKVVNCSFGSTSKSSALEDAVKSAKSKGVLLVVAAGNDGDSIESAPEYPASFTEGNVLTVAATDSSGALASFSNFGSKSVDVAAPGDGIYSTYPTSSYRCLSGTSMAAPLVAAAAALLRKHDSGLSYADIRSALKASVDKDPALSGKTVTGGRLNLDHALQQAG